MATKTKVYIDSYVVNYWISGKKHQGGVFLLAEDAGNFAKKIILKMNDKTTTVTKVEVYHKKVSL